VCKLVFLLESGEVVGLLVFEMRSGNSGFVGLVVAGWVWWRRNYRCDVWLNGRSKVGRIFFLLCCC